MTHFFKSSKKDKVLKDIKPKAKNDDFFQINNPDNTLSASVFGNILIIGFISLIIVLLINSLSAYYKGKKLEQQISASAFQGISMLLEGGKKTSQIQLNNAKKAFLEAENFFNEAKTKAWFINSDKSIYSNKSDFNSAINGFLDGGVAFANAGNHFLDAMEYFNLIPLYFVSNNKNPEKFFPSITQTLKQGLEKIDLAIKEINIASHKIYAINPEILPKDLQDKYIFAKEKLQEISTVLNDINEYYPAVLKLLGDGKTHSYLILFQNNQEMRPTGGFIGSFALVDLTEGYITKLETHDVYQLTGAGNMQIDPPDDLRLFTSNWRFRDSNYSYDFTRSAEKAIWFLDLEASVEVDTVIAINQGLLRDMLEITGPIQVGKFAKLNSYNYDTVLSYVIESKMWGREDPKHILRVFVDAFAKEILNEKYLAKVSAKLLRAIEQKHILFYSKDEEVLAFFDNLNLTARPYNPKEKEDYLAVINLAVGTKSDKLIEEKITHDTEIKSNGRIVNTLTLERTHLYSPEILRQWKEILSNVGINKPEEYVLDILGRGTNVSSVQIYVPKGSRLMSSTDPSIEIKFDEELDKTYFFTTLTTKASTKSVLRIKYELPFSLDFSNSNLDVYKLIAEKMPGHPGQLFTKRILKTNDVLPIITYPDGAFIENETAFIYAKDLVYDRYFSSLIKRSLK